MLSSFVIRRLLLAKYYSGDQIKQGEIGGACGTRGEEEKCIQGLGKPEINRLFRTLRCSSKDNIKMYHTEIGWEDVDWVNLAQFGNKLQAVVIRVINLVL